MSAAKVSHGATETRREGSASMRPAVAPALRFKGFDLSEETVVFGEVVSRRKSGARSTRELPSVEYEDVVSFEGRLCRDVKAKRDGRQGIRFSEGDVLFGKLRPYLGNWLRASFDGVAVGDWWVLEPLGLRGSYLYQLIQSNPFQLIANQSSGSKMPRSDWSVVANGQFRVVVDPKQQEALGCFLASIDSLRATSQSALEKLQALKKSMLVNMFPQGDAKVPKIRFKGFEGEWRKIGLGELMNFSKGFGYTKSDLCENGIPLFLYGRMYTVYQIEVNEIDTFTKSVIKGAVFSKGNEIVSPASGETAEDIVRATAVTAPGILLGGDLNIMSPKNDNLIDVVFAALSLTFGKSRNDIMMQAQGKTVVHIHNSDMIGISLRVPALHEQRKIAAYFKSLDRLIAARRDEIEQLKHMKAALLNRMFV